MTKLIPISLLTYMLISLYGCSNQAPTSVEEETREPGVVDYLTGAEQIKQYKKIKSKLKDIDESHQGRYDDF